MEHHLVLRVVAKLLLPYIFLFGLYVQFHGDYGPGGGFQAGVIIGAGMVLYALLFGVDNARRVAPPWLLRSLAGMGVLLYAGTGVVSMLLGGSYLDYSVLAHDPVHGQELGVMLVELGVLLTVSAVMSSLFFLFARP